ncbi:MAG TPA: poly-beta-1,6-N-acetyl-D-glucosamine biosynthesis protein PgaD [Saccharofermentans sp.]|nr:poly-beta-1,6-N-acetyl-D-glucosamine biosynthesis protein PgaD [Saccharofermentans sp.]
MYILTYVIFIIYGSLALTFGWYIPDLWIYNRHMLEETSNLIYALLVIILVVILVMTFWRSYNSIRFGKLRRRQMPLNVSDKEISDYFKVSEEQVKKYKKERIVIFDDNVI